MKGKEKSVTTRGAGSDKGAKPDYVLLALVLILVAVGLQAVYSSTFGLAVTQYDDVNYFLIRQSIWAVLGAIAMVVCMKIPYGFWRKASLLLMVVALAMLVLVLFPGLGVNQYGAQRWLKLGPLPAIQPSEFVKLASIIYVSAWLSGQGKRPGSFTAGFIPFMLFLGLIIPLVIMQPDMGTALIIACVMATVFFLGGGSLSHIVALGIMGVVTCVILVFVAEYRSDRWYSFIDPWNDPAGRGFHIIQLLIALGSGGLWGLGLGASRQKFFYVPGAHTDGIFAIVGEEVGFIGGLVVIVLLAAVVYKGITIVTKAPDRFGALLAAGITCWIAYQALINIGGITRSIPLTGVPLPFISYGGSSLAATMAAIGILLNISKSQPRATTGSGLRGKIS
ncbi:MAG: putative lipid flippase FtsW [Dehalococcoidia bacterium]|nr:putative lipid flippase FtsW [Dehalococcoidia bacterium]